MTRAKAGIDSEGMPYLAARWATLGLWRNNAELIGADSLAGALIKAAGMAMRGAGKIRVYRSGKEGRVISLP